MAHEHTPKPTLTAGPTAVAAAAQPTLARARALPKVLLHDHLDGGLRVPTILELSDEIGWTPRLPTTDPAALLGRC